VRTTLTIDDRLLMAIKRKAAERNASVKAIINEALRYGLEAMDSQPEPREYLTSLKSLGVRSGLDPDRLGQVADEFDDEETVQRRL